ncbi:hypothetical protein FQA47_017348 [Oryzias melastigma]|uniref:Uncharacterized protein n=1 Tax=Oryzias melastigma TaxID=30732 RepID=A0A834BWS2_ORYME|nr:hypothetical protein FQA47_017348 [Oryzias melastigma]
MEAKRNGSYCPDRTRPDRTVSTPSPALKARGTAGQRPCCSHLQLEMDLTSHGAPPPAQATLVPQKASSRNRKSEQIRTRSRCGTGIQT